MRREKSGSGEISVHVTCYNRLFIRPDVAKSSRLLPEQAFFDRKETLEMIMYRGSPSAS